jgi:16S rRNA G966 N2-methylase RsmD
VGGDSLHLGRVFRRVHSVEIDDVVAFCLKHNVNQAGLSQTVSVHHGDSFTVVPRLIRDDHVNLVYIDPAWGGTEYKEKEKVQLTIGNQPVKVFLESLSATDRHLYLFMKVPVNHDREQFGSLPVEEKVTVMNHRGVPCMEILFF